MSTLATSAGPRLAFHNKTDAGRTRDRNEDYYGHWQQDGRDLFVVADGMGGERGGGVASRTAVLAVKAVFAQSAGLSGSALLADAIRAANTRCLQVQQEQEAYRGMGTTLDLLLVEKERGRAWWGHVGDSRILLVRDGKAEQLTRDHTVVQQLVDQGLVSPEAALDHPKRHVLSRVVGRDASLEADIPPEPQQLKTGDVLVLCTDGLVDVVNADEIGSVVQTSTPEVACEKLVDLANDRGGHDNITLQVVQYSARSAGAAVVAANGWPPFPLESEHQPTPPSKSRSRLPMFAVGMIAGVLLTMAVALTVRVVVPTVRSILPSSKPNSSEKANASTAGQSAPAPAPNGPAGVPTPPTDGTAGGAATSVTPGQQKPSPLQEHAIALAAHLQAIGATGETGKALEAVVTALYRLAGNGAAIQDKNPFDHAVEPGHGRPLAGALKEVKSLTEFHLTPEEKETLESTSKALQQAIKTIQGRQASEAKPRVK